MVAIDHKQLIRIFDALKKQGYTIIGPTKRGVSIVLDEIQSPADLPINSREEQQPGVYRLRERTDQAYFGYNAGPQSWKKFLFPPSLNLIDSERSGKSFTARVHGNGSQNGGKEKQPPKLAFFGMHACDIRALQIHDKIFCEGVYTDPYYQRVRETLFIVAVNCLDAGGTCFCSSMGTGPQVTNGFDLALTEQIRGEEHSFIVEEGSDAGSKLMKGIPCRAAGKNVKDEIAQTMKRVAQQMGRKLETKGLKEALQENFDHARWDDVAKRCLACANCTLVCPTCFCSTVEDVTDLTGAGANRIRTWDSCFTLEFSYIHGGSVRPTIRSRYRQWLTHKLSNWVDQFGSSGCVGCGRCITWCPAGIDITEEAAAICKGTAHSSTTS